jgi:hypothetical protein
MDGTLVVDCVGAVGRKVTDWVVADSGKVDYRIEVIQQLARDVSNVAPERGYRWRWLAEVASLVKVCIQSSDLMTIRYKKWNQY